MRKSHKVSNLGGGVTIFSGIALLTFLQMGCKICSCQKDHQTLFSVSSFFRVLVKTYIVSLRKLSLPYWLSANNRKHPVSLEIQLTLSSGPSQDRDSAYDFQKQWIKKYQIQNLFKLIKHLNMKYQALNLFSVLHITSFNNGFLCMTLKYRLQ